MYIMCKKCIYNSCAPNWLNVKKASSALKNLTDVYYIILDINFWTLKENILKKNASHQILFLKEYRLLDTIWSTRGI